MNSQMQKEAAVKGLSSLLNIIKKPALVAGGVGAAGIGGFVGGNAMGKKDITKKFNEYNKAENRIIANRAYAMGMSQKQAGVDEDEIIEQIAINKIANGHAIHFANAVINSDISNGDLEKVASSSNSIPFGDTGYNYGDFDDLELCATKTAKLSGVMDAIKSTAGLISQIGKGKAVKGLESAMSTIQAAKSVMKTNLPTAYNHMAKNKKLYSLGAAGAAGYTAGKM